MTAFERHASPDLGDRVALVTAFDGWVNAAQAATGAMDVLLDGAETIVTFDADDLFDYRDTRPTVEFISGVPQAINPPGVTLAHRRGPTDLLLLTGTEPSLGWRSFTTTVAELAGEFGVGEMVVLGGIPWAVPHTRPVTLITTASSAERMPADAEHPEGMLEVPASVNAALELELIGRGVPSIGFYARVPHYLGAEFTAASLALLERLSNHAGLDMDLTGLATEADSQRLQLDGIAEGRPEVRTMIEQLETLVDGTSAVDGDQIASEIERFLRNRGESEL